MSYGLDLSYNKPKRDLNVQTLKRALLYMDTATRELARKISRYILTNDCSKELIFEFMTLLHWCSERAWHAVSQHVNVLDEAGFQPKYARPDMALLGYTVDFQALADRFHILFPEISKATTELAGTEYNEFQTHIEKTASQLEKYAEWLGLDDYEEKFMDYGNVKKLGIFIREYKCPNCGKSYAVRMNSDRKTCKHCNSRLLPQRWQLYPPPDAPVWNYCEPPRVYLEELKAQGLEFDRKKVKPPFAVNRSK